MNWCMLMLLLYVQHFLNILKTCSAALVICAIFRLIICIKNLWLSHNLRGPIHFVSINMRLMMLMSILILISLFPRTPQFIRKYWLYWEKLLVQFSAWISTFGRMNIPAFSWSLCSQHTSLFIREMSKISTAKIKAQHVPYQKSEIQSKSNLER